MVTLGGFVEKTLAQMAPRFAHRDLELQCAVQSAGAIFIPAEVLTKIIVGLVRNAVEYTPDGGRVDVIVKDRQSGVCLEVRDTGTGITLENQRLLFENYFTPPETLQYSSKKPFDFNAGGKGFDLLRMKIFSERYHFDLSLSSQRCAYLVQPETLCPGNLGRCAQCDAKTGCRESGGTTVRATFPRYAEY